VATVTMPQLGETVVEGTITKWLKQEGDTVAQDEPLFEISTDKVDTEVPSPVAGTLVRIAVQEGQTVSVGTELATIDAGDGAAESAAQPEVAAPATSSSEQAPPAGATPPAQAPAAPAASAPATAAPAASAPADGGERSAILSPLVRRLAEEHDVDLSKVTGTGTGGRITKADVMAFVESGGGAQTPAAGPSAPAGAPAASEAQSPPAVGAPAASASPAAPAAPPAAATPPAAQTPERPPTAHLPEAGGAPAAPPTPTLAGAQAPAPQTPAPQTATPQTAAPQTAAPQTGSQPATLAEDEELVPLTRMRQVIAQHMVGSVQTSARAWTLVEVNMENVVRLREMAKDSFGEREGVPLTYMPFIASAVDDALLAFPYVNAELRGDQLVLRKHVNLGIAVALEDGLIVPVVVGTDSMNIAGLARAINDVATRARNRQLKPDEVHGSTFTITNPGPFGSIMSVPIINQPNAAILAFDTIEKRPVVVGDAIAIRHMVYLSMSWDHRIIDGSTAAQFLARVKENLETWDFAPEVGLPAGS